MIIAKTETFTPLKDQQIKVTRTWKLSATVLLVVIGALDMIKQGSEKYIK